MLVHYVCDGNRICTRYFRCIPTMTKALLDTKKHSYQYVWLYRIVFASRSVLALILLLCFSFLLQPVENVFAAEDTETTAPEEVAGVIEEVLEAPVGISEVSLHAAGEQVDTDADAEKDGGSELEGEIESALGPDSEENENDDVLVSTALSEVAASSSVSSISTVAPDNNDIQSATTSGEEIATSSQQNSSASTADPVLSAIDDEDLDVPRTPVAAVNSAQSPAASEVVDAEEVTEGDAGESLPQALPVIESGQFFSDDNHYRFNKNACVAVGNGNYHCAVSDVIPSTNMNEATVYAALKNGVMEIFFNTGSDPQQITDNAFDDTEPKFDPVSRKVVWQRLIAGRQQIILYDLDTKIEKQLTFGTSNNMQPAVSAEGVAWQYWDGDDWEILYYDGATTTQLSDNDAPDLAPVLQDEYIIWTTVLPEAQYLQVYSLLTKTTKTITNYEGGTVVNPRFVLVYDTKFENGDVTTHTFDPESGVSMPVAATPAAPVNIPPVEPTGETRALVQSKPTQKEDVTDGGDDLSAEPLPVPQDVAEDETGTPDFDLILPDSTEGGSATTSVTAEEPFELTEYDLVITDFSSTSAQQNNSD